MTYIVPNYFLQEHPEMVIGSDNLFTIVYTSKEAGEKIEVRNSMHVMILVTEGGKNLSLKSENIEIKSGDIFFLLQGNYFMSDILSEYGKYEAILVYFDDSFVLDFIEKHGLDLSDGGKKSVVTFSSNSFLKELMNSYQDYKDIDRKNELLKLKTEEIFLHLLSSDKKEFSSFLNAVKLSSKERLVHILEDNLDLIESVEDMYKIARISENELRSQMQKFYNLSPKKWLDIKRLEQASILLKNSDETISQIATKCHYSTSSWFGVQFKKYFGLTPKVYREQNR